MKDRDAKATVNIDVRVPEWLRETEIYGMLVQSDWIREDLFTDPEACRDIP